MTGSADADRQASLAVLAALIAAVVVLLAAGRGPLAAPPLSVDGFAAWVDERGAVTAAVALARLAALGAAAWLATVTSLAAAGAWSTAQKAIPPALRHAVGGLAGVGVASVVVLGGGSGERRVDVAAEPLVLLPAESEGTATMTLLEQAPPLPPAPAAEPAPAPAVDEWVVSPGESFWSIAVEVVGDTLGRQPTDAEVDGYWRALIAANADRLVSANPDLLLPGQSLHLPA